MRDALAATLISALIVASVLGSCLIAAGLPI
jgi:hypothetical protein